MNAFVEEFRQNGFAVARGLMAGDELAALQAEAAAQIQAGAGRGPESHYMSGVAADGSSVLFRIDAVLQKRLENDSMIAALAHPGVVERATALVGGAGVCWSDALLWKGPAGGAEVPLHSARGWGDATTAHEHLVVDIYLDHADPSNGCLKVLPGSHRLDPDEHMALLAMGLDAPGLVDVILEPGDVLFHSEWMLHGSAATGPLGSATRRILYFAFRSPAMFGRRYSAACFRRMELAHRVRGEHAYTVPSDWAADVAAVSDDEAWAVGWFGDANQSV